MHVQIGATRTGPRFCAISKYEPNMIRYHQLRLELVRTKIVAQPTEGRYRVRPTYVESSDTLAMMSPDIYFK